MVVRRGVGQPPRTPADGTLLDQGPAGPAVADPAVPLTPEPVYYTIFARRNDAAGPAYSPGISVELDEASPAAFIRLAEREARQGAGPGPLSGRMALLFAVRDKSELAQALLRSEVVVVRGWALTELAELYRASPADVRLQESLRQALRDPEPALCREAAAALLSQPQADDAILGLARFVGQGDLDDAVRMVDVFQAAGLDRAQAVRVRDVLEEERPTDCPECHVQLAHRDRTDHLRRQHGYIDVAGSLVPRAVALERLWDRALLQGEQTAHDRLLEVLAPAREQVPLAYVVSLEEALTRRAEVFGLATWDIRSSQPPTLLQPYIGCLLKNVQAEALLEQLIRSGMTLVRALGRQSWATILNTKLRSTKLTGKSLREELDRLGAALEDAILLCRRLAELGLDARATQACLALLEADRPVACTECGTRLRQGDLETHLRRAHTIFQFRGERRSFAETRDIVLNAVCGSMPDEPAWKTLVDLVRDRHAEAWEEHVVAWLCHRLKTLERKPRDQALLAVAEVLAQDPYAPHLVAALVRPMKVAAYQAVARQLALEVGTRLSAPVEPSVVNLLKPLLADRDLPRDARDNAVIALLRTTGKAGVAAQRLLEAYVANSGKLKAIAKLHKFEQRIGQTAALDALCTRLEDQVRMTCPKCGVEMVRTDMVTHLWDRHRLVLDGRRVREPRRVLDDWVVDYQLEKDAALLERCRELAHKLDPKKGIAILQRTLLRHGIEDAAAQADLCGLAVKNHATLCPHCFAELPLPRVPSLPPLYFDKERLEGVGYRVALHEGFFFPTLEIDTPRDVLYHDREPGSPLTRNGALVSLVAPCTLGFFVLTELIGQSAIPVSVALLLAVGLGMLLGGLVMLFWPASAPGKDRLVNGAWSELVPEILENPQVEGLAFLGSLALASVRKGDAQARAGTLAEACEKIEARAATEPASLRTLAALVRLAVEDGFERDEDLLLLVAEQVGSCLQGVLPLAHAAEILEDFFAPKASHWPRKVTARLQVLVCAQAFVAGLEISDLVELGKTHPTLGAAFGVTDADRLAQLRSLWTLQSSRPWEHLGKAAVIFDLATRAPIADKALGRTPDLLLLVRDEDIAIDSKGVWFQDTCFTHMPQRVEVAARFNHDTPGFDLIVGNKHFWFTRNPKESAAILESWLRYYFQDFVANLATWYDRPSTEAGKRLRNINSQVCPDCRCAFMGRLGNVGLALE